MKSKVITILIGLMCCLCGCSMTMTPEERVALLYGGQNQEESQTQTRYTGKLLKSFVWR